MGIPVLILGESGTGKSASLRNFKPDDVGIINVSGKPLPFKNKLKTFNSDNYLQIEDVIKRSKAKSIVIDDSNYLMANAYFRNAKVTGFQKFTDIAVDFWTLIQMVIKELPNDKIVYFMAHIETDSNGKERYKTVGKMLDNYSIEGLCTIVLQTSVTDGKFRFMTQNNGFNTVKSPIGMFEDTEIDNDLKFVDEKIREYYEI